MRGATAARIASQGRLSWALGSARGIDSDLASDLAVFTHDPAGFVRYAFPWGEGALADSEPRAWFLDLCERITAKLRAGRGLEWNLICEAIASGNGIGKSAATAQLLLWAISTFPHARGLVTANTGAQLLNRTWPELVKWHSLCITRHWFQVGAQRIFHKQYPRTWFIDAAIWDEHNPQAFAGLHNEGKRQIILFDEASEIPDVIWDKADLTMSDRNTELLWFAFGNPTFAGGRFFKCWNEHRSQWGTVNIDSRTVSDAARMRAEYIGRIYGEDSPQFSYGVKGEFIEGDAWQLVHKDWLYRMRDNDRASDGSQPKLRVSVDVADGGEDDTVITAAHHFAAHTRVLRQRAFSFQPAIATIESADAAERMFSEWGGDKSRDDIVVDSLGVGAGTAGTLMKRGYRVVRYVGGEASAAPARWRNRRVQSYMVARDAIRDGSIVAAPGAFGDAREWAEFEKQALSVRSKPGNEAREDLVTREEMRRNGVKSPDRMDSLVMQFATQAPVLTYNDQPAVYVHNSSVMEGYAG